METDLDGNGSIDRSTEAAAVLNTDGSKTDTFKEFGTGGALTSKTVVSTSANGLSKSIDWSATGGSVTRKMTDVTALNADGSTVNTLTYLKASGALESKTTTTVSADALSTTVTKDFDGDAIIDQKRVSLVNADGSTTTTLTDLGADGIAIADKKTITVSANGLSRTTDYDTNGNGQLDARTTEVTVLNSNGSTTETITRYNGSLQVIDRTVVDVSADDLTIQTKWDTNADGVYEQALRDVTVLNADGSTTRTVSNLDPGSSALYRQYQTTTSANGLSITSSMDFDGVGGVDQSSTDVTALNADGSVTRTVKATRADGTKISETVATTSADGRTVAVYEDRSGSGFTNRTTTTSTVVLADGSTVATATTTNTSQAVTERQTITTSANGAEVSIVRDADGNGDTEQTQQSSVYVDGSSKTIITGYNDGGGKTDQTTIVTAADGLSSTMEWDLDGNGSVDRKRTTANALNADGSWSSVATDITVSTGALASKTTTTMSADGRTKTVSKDVNGNGTVDSVETSVTDSRGSTTSTTVNNGEARDTKQLQVGEVY